MKKQVSNFDFALHAVISKSLKELSERTGLPMMAVRVRYKQLVRHGWSELPERKEKEMNCEVTSGDCAAKSGVDTFRARILDDSRKETINSLQIGAGFRYNGRLYIFGGVFAGYWWVAMTDNGVIDQFAPTTKVEPIKVQFTSK